MYSCTRGKNVTEEEKDEIQAMTATPCPYVYNIIMSNDIRFGNTTRLGLYEFATDINYLVTFESNLVAMDTAELVYAYLLFIAKNIERCLLVKMLS